MTSQIVVEIVGAGAAWPLVASNLVSLALSAAILLLKLRYRGRDDARTALARG
jgi:hypothetical protein